MKPVDNPVSQVFGGNPQMYAQFSLKGHNGIDFSTQIGTQVKAPEKMRLESSNQGPKGYGLHLIGFNDTSEQVFGHLSKLIKTGWVERGEIIGLTGNTGFSTGPHLHWGYRRRNGFKGTVLNYDNGYLGYIDQSKLPIWEDQEEPVDQEKLERLNYLEGLIKRIVLNRVNEFKLPDGTIQQLFNYVSFEDFIDMSGSMNNVVKIDMPVMDYIKGSKDRAPQLKSEIQSIINKY